MLKHALRKTDHGLQLVFQEAGLHCPAPVFAGMGRQETANWLSELYQSQSDSATV